MPHYTESQISAANHVDLAAYLLSRGEKLSRHGNQYLWEKNQVWIHGHEWYSHYESKGGHAVSFVMRYFGLPFQNAVGELIGGSAVVSSQTIEPDKIKESKSLILPPRSETTNRLLCYLTRERFIAREVVEYFVNAKTLYEDVKYHNCVFVGLDEDGVPRHCHIRSTSGNYKRTESGSQAEYAFHHSGESEWLFVFEAPIDMLAFITLHRKDWQKHSYVALCSVSERALLHRLEVNPNLRKIVLCLDNDNAGISACKRIKGILETKGYSDVRILHSVNKDWDEDIKAQNGVAPIPADNTNVEAVRKICKEAVENAAKLKPLPMLYRKVQDSYTAVINSNRFETEKQVGHLRDLLLLLAKDECRKSLAPIEWDELQVELVKAYIPSADNGDTDTRLCKLDTDMKSVFAVYDTQQMVCDREIFLKPILKACMDCVCLLKYLGGNIDGT